MTFDQLLEEFKTIHGGRYQYPKQPYKNQLSKLRIVCCVHGEFTQQASSHLKGLGCSKCGVEKRKQDNLTKWKDRCRLLHSQKYDYKMVTGASGKQQIICPIHGEFFQSAKAHSDGNGCQKCGVISAGNAARYSIEEFKCAASKVHGSRYQYEGYSGVEAPVKILCNHHGWFSQKAEFHLRGNGCPRCADQTRSANAKRNWSDPLIRNRYHEAFKKNFEVRSQNTKNLWLKAEFRDLITRKSVEMWNNDEFRKQAALIRSRQPSCSSLNLATYEILDRFGVEYVAEHPVGPWNFDVYIPSHNLLLELNGEYWHSLPKAIRNDKAKATYVERYHPELKLVTIWEIDFFKDGAVADQLSRLLGLSRHHMQQPDWSKLSVHVIDRKRADAVYSNHYLGSSRGNTHFGLFHDRDLIGSCSFGSFLRKQQFTKYKGAVELTRFCISPDWQVKNLSSWFLSRCVKRIHKPIITYADTTLGHKGTIYKACNFKFSHELEPDYYYVDERGWVMHKRTIWGRSSKMKMSESSYAKSHGLSKKWGGKKLCFTFGL